MVVARGSWLCTATLASLLGASACTCTTPDGSTDAAKPQAAAVAPAPEAKAPTEAPAIPELSEEDRRLIAADPKDLSPDDRRKRAYALRRKIMQNPDSPAARTLEDLRKAADEGTIQPPGAGPHFEVRRTADATPPSAPPAGTRTDAPPPP